MIGAAVRRLPLLGLLALWALAPAQAAPKARMTELEAGLVQRALDRGTLIYVYDRAAWLATDDLKIKLPDFNRKVGGWIVDGPAKSPQLVFFDRDETDPKMVYVADFDGTRLVSSRLLAEADDRALTPARKAMVAARSAALNAAATRKAMFCSKAMPNTVILPPTAPGGSTLVYLLTPQSTRESIPMGGHNLVEVSADGSAGKSRPFTNSCMEMPIKEMEGRQLESLVVTHFLDPVPTEIHVFSSLAAGLPIFVLTRNGKRLWVVEGHRMELVDRKSTRLPQASTQRTR